MPGVKIKWRRGVFAEVRTMPAVMRELASMASDVAREAGEGFEVRGPDVTGGRVRGRAAVVTASHEAIRRNARDLILIKALNAGRRG